MLVLPWFNQLGKSVSFFLEAALVSFFNCHILQAVYFCGIQVNKAILFKAYIVVRKLSKLTWKHTHSLAFVWWLDCQGSVNMTLMKANNYNVLTTTMVNGLFEVSSITLAVKNLLMCLIYLDWENWKQSAVLLCVKWGQTVSNSPEM